jgi:membrane protease YdiL (CAAX protease family)
MQIFEIREKDYYWDTNWDYVLNPICTVYKVSLGNLITFIKNIQIERKNCHSWEGRVKDIGKSLLYKIQGKEKPGSTEAFFHKHNAFKEVGIAIVVFAIAAPILGIIFNTLIRVLFTNRGIVQGTQEIENLLENICTSNKEFPIIQNVLKSYIVGYVSFFGPGYEEDFFRGSILTWIKDKQSNPDSTFSKVNRIALNGLAFGACHLSPFQGLYNVPVFVITALMGIVLGILKETRENIYACTALHVINNSLYCLKFLK